MSIPKDITELRDQLLEQFELLKNDPRRMLQTRELTNAAGKVVATIKCQLEYALLKGEEPDIPFLGETSGKPLKRGVNAIAIGS